MLKKIITRVALNVAALAMIFNTFNQSSALSVLLFTTGLCIILLEVSELVGCPSYTERYCDVYQNIRLIH